MAGLANLEIVVGVLQVKNNGYYKFF